MIDDSEKRKRHLVLELQSSRVYEKRSNALMLDLSSSISVFISRLKLGRNSSFQILRNSFALKF